MTHQTRDTLRYHEIDYPLEASGPVLDIASVLGFTPRAFSTACHRGYIAGFTLVESRLVLDSLYVGLASSLKMPRINGVVPSSCRRSPWDFGCNYKGLHLPVAFSGGILLTAKPILDIGFRGCNQWYEHLASLAVWTFATVTELVFQEGRLTKEHDCSLTFGDLRRTIVDGVNAHVTSPVPHEKIQAILATLECRYPMYIPNPPRIASGDFESVRRMKECQQIFTEMGLEFKAWEVPFMVMLYPDWTREQLVRTLRMKESDDPQGFMKGARELFDRLLKIRREDSDLGRGLMDYLETFLFLSKEVMAMVAGFIVAREGGREDARRWIRESSQYRRKAVETVRHYTDICEIALRAL